MLTTNQAAARAGCTALWIRKLAREGKIPGAQKIGRDWMIPEESVSSLMKKSRMGRPRKGEGEGEKAMKTAKLLIWASGPRDRRGEASALVSIIVPQKEALAAARDIEKRGDSSEYFKKYAHTAGGLRDDLSAQSGHGVTIEYESGKRREVRGYK